MTTFDVFRHRLNDYRNSLVRRAKLEKEMMIVPVELEKHYLALDDAERLLADKVICEWLRSDDPGTRWDAEYLIKKFRIVSAADALRELDLRLQKTSSVSAPDRDELAKVIRLILWSSFCLRHGSTASSPCDGNHPCDAHH